MDFAPSLAGLADKTPGRLDFGKSGVARTLPDYLVAKLRNPRIYGEQLKMPFFGFEPREAGRLATFLLSRSKEIPGSYRHRPGQLHLPEPAGEVGRIFAAYRCFSCHRLGDRGGDLAPDLTFEGSKVRREWLKEFLRNPYAVRPALEERMPRFNLTDQEVEALADYTRLLLRHQAIDAAIDAAAPVTGAARDGAVVAGNAETGRKLYFDTYTCHSCHSIRGEGGYYGPALEKAAIRLQPAWLLTRLNDAHPHEPGAREPVLAIPPAERRHLLAFLQTLPEEEK